MTTVEAINVIEQALEIGRKAGAYTFRDSTLIFNALGVLSQLKEAEENKQAAPTQVAPETQEPAQEPKAKKGK